MKYLSFNSSIVVPRYDHLDVLGVIVDVNLLYAALTARRLLGVHASLILPLLLKGDGTGGDPRVRHRH